MHLALDVFLFFGGGVLNSFSQKAIVKGDLGWQAVFETTVTVKIKERLSECWENMYKNAIPFHTHVLCFGATVKKHTKHYLVL